MTNEEIQKAWQDALDKWVKEAFFDPLFDDLIKNVPQ